MKSALLGLEQSGRKTFFTLMTGRQPPASLKDGECVEGVAPIRDPRVDVLSSIFKPEKTRYAENIIALCPAIKEGAEKKLWLEPARRCDMLCIIVRDFKSDQVYHPAGSVNSERDRGTIEAELLFADADLITKRLDRLGKEKRAGQNATQAQEEQALLKIKATLEREMRLASAPLEPHELDAIRSLNLLCMKPVLWVLNVDEDRVAEPAPPGTLRVSCRIEQEIAALDDEKERTEYLRAIGLESSGLDRLNRTIYDLLGLMSFYTVGPDEVRAWTIRKGTLAPAAAGKVHTDMERGFIRVEIIKYDDLVAAGGEAEAKARGKSQTKGRDYAIEDGDICHFRFNV